MAGVKRRYDGAARRAEAERIREHLIHTARELMLSDGYAATTILTIAGACGVSVEAVYKRFPGKPALLRAIVEQALRGSGPVSAETRSDALEVGDLGGLLEAWGQLSAEVAPRVAPILLLLDAAAAAARDPELTSLARELDDNRRTRMTDNARRLADAGQLPGDLSVERAADILWTYSSPQIYDLLIVRSGWNLNRYAAFISAGLAAHLSP